MRAPNKVLNCPYRLHLQSPTSPKPAFGHKLNSKWAEGTRLTRRRVGFKTLDYQAISHVNQTERRVVAPAVSETFDFEPRKYVPFEYLSHVSKLVLISQKPLEKDVLRNFSRTCFGRRKLNDGDGACRRTRVIPAIAKSRS